MGKQISGFVVIALLLILGISFGLPTIKSGMEAVQLTNVSNRVSTVADFGLLTGDIPASPGLTISTIDQSQDFLCLKVTDQKSGRDYYYDTSSRVASLTTCKKG